MLYVKQNKAAAKFYVSFLYCTCVHCAVGREEPEISINLSKGCRETDQPNNLESAHTTSAAKARAAAASHNHILLSHRLPIHHTSNSSTITTTITSCRSIYHHRNAYTSHNIYIKYTFFQPTWQSFHIYV